MTKLNHLAIDNSELTERSKFILEWQEYQLLRQETEEHLRIVSEHKKILDKYKNNFVKSCIELQKLGYTKDELASMSGVSRITITKYMEIAGFTSSKQQTDKARRTNTKVRNLVENKKGNINGN